KYCFSEARLRDCHLPRAGYAQDREKSPRQIAEGRAVQVPRVETERHLRAPSLLRDDGKAAAAQLDSLLQEWQASALQEFCAISIWKSTMA
ncbi:MAG: hypothetical protein WA234_07800, partial [Rectinemataceae bacterium]